MHSVPNPSPAIPILRTLLVLLLLVVLARQGWTFVLFFDLGQSQLADAAFRILPMAFAAWICFFIAHLHRDWQQRTWRWMGWSLTAYTVGNLWFYIQSYGFRVPAYPSGADVFYVLTMPLLIAVFFSLPQSGIAPLARLRLGLDAGVLVGVAAGYLWFFVLSTAITNHLERGPLNAEILLAMLYTVLDLLALALALVSMPRWALYRLRAPARVLLGGLVCWSVADCYFLARCFILNSPDAHPLEAGWEWGALLFASAGLLSLRQKPLPAEVVHALKLSEDYSPWLSRFGVYVAMLAGIPLVVLAPGADSLAKNGVQIITVMVVVFVIARQLLLSYELGRSNQRLWRLSEELESRVRQRTQDLEESRSELEVQATHDPLTGLPNRVLYTQRLTQALLTARLSGKAVGVMVVDLDRFKDINDALGHPVGDVVLIEVANRFRACMPPGATLARFGGDEFLVLLPELEPAQAGLLAERTGRGLIESLSRTVRVEEAEFFLTASVGMSLAPQDGGDAATLQKHADAAMYRAKREGLGYRVFTPDLNARAVERLEIERALRQALEADPSKAFHLLYQPIVEASTGRIVALEALIRWHHPQIRLSPAQFVPIAEESGLIVPLGNWVLNEACHQAVAWQRAGLPPVRVSVNVATAQFERPDFVDTVKRVLDTSLLEPRWLALELVESVLIQRFDEIASRFAQLQALGVRLALDDFGAGYSSLSYLHRLPFNVLKVDRSFTQDLGGERDSKPLVAAILSIAQEFHLEAIAEGIETKTQLQTLQGLGCKAMQGYLFSRPVDAQTIAEMLKEGRLEPNQA